MDNLYTGKLFYTVFKFPVIPVNNECYLCVYLQTTRRPRSDLPFCGRCFYFANCTFLLFFISPRDVRPDKLIEQRNNYFNLK